MAQINIQYFDAVFNGVISTIGIFVDDSNNVITAQLIDGGPAREQYDSYDVDFVEGAELYKYCDFNGALVTLKVQYQNPFAVIDTIVPNSPFCTVQPPSCDLYIDYINRDPETEQGANDGSIEVVAVTSFPGKEFSLNGIDWQQSGIFNNLAPAWYQVRVRDSNGCLRTAQVEVPPYNNPLISSPIKKYGTGNLSRWNAAFNTIAFIFEKKGIVPSNFRVETKIISGSNPNNQINVISINYPDNKGITRVELQQYLKTLVKPVDNFNYDVINFRDINLAASFTLSYREVWDGGSSQWYNILRPYYVTYASMQLGERFGGNLAEYVPFLKQPDPDKLAKFLTDFNQPILNMGLPFDVSFIYSENIINQQLVLEQIPLDINGNPVNGGILDSFLLNEDASYLLNEDGSRFLIEEGSPGENLDVDVIEQLGINRLMFPSNYSIEVHSLNIRLYYLVNDVKKYVTKQLNVLVNRPCPSDPYIYLKWINHLGTWDYFRFGYNQTISIDTSNESTIKRNITDWENNDTVIDVIEKSAGNKISVGADLLTPNETKALSWLRKSIKVQMLTSLSPIKWQTVTVQPGSFTIQDTRKNTGNIKITLNLPDSNIQTQ